MNQITCPMKQILLASSSPYRKQLLQRLKIDFQTASPDIDESRIDNETAHALVARLSECKARALAPGHPDCLIIGSDQVATLDSKILTKPGGHANAVLQLQLASGNRVKFLTGLCLLNSATGNVQIDVIEFSVVFRKLTKEQIENYLKIEQPYNCAGSFKSEGLGAALFEKMQGDDPTSLIGLPLIRLTHMLADEGVDVLK